MLLDDDGRWRGVVRYPWTPYQAPTKVAPSGPAHVLVRGWNGRRCKSRQRGREARTPTPSPSPTSAVRVCDLDELKQGCGVYHPLVHGAVSALSSPMSLACLQPSRLVSARRSVHGDL